MMVNSLFNFIQFYKRRPVLRIALHLAFWAIVWRIQMPYLEKYPHFLKKPYKAIFALVMTFSYAFFYYIFIWVVIKKAFTEKQYHWAVWAYFALLIFSFFAYLLETWMLVQPQFYADPQEVQLNKYFWADSLKQQAIKQGFWRMFLNKDAYMWTISQFFSSFMFIPIGIVKHFFENTYRKNRLEIDHKRLELEYLKTQLNPHFLFNTLNNLYALLLREDARFSPYIDKLINLIKYSTKQAELSQVPIKTEIAFIENYLELEGIRYGSRVQIQYTKQVNDSDEQSIPPMILIPFVENAFKHGANKSIDAVFININLNLTENQLHFNIKNSFQRQSSSSFGGIGLSNTKRRLALLYPEKHDIEVQDAEPIYEVSLNIKLR